MKSKVVVVFFMMVILALTGIINGAEESQNDFESAFDIGNANIKMEETSEFKFSNIHSKEGQRTVISFKAICYTPKPGGCSYIMSLQLNGTNITRYNPEGTERLIEREPFLTLNRPEAKPIPVFDKNNNILLFFDKDATEANKASTDNAGANFIFDVTDLVQEENTLKISNLLKTKKGDYSIITTDMKIGWLKSSDSKKSYELEDVTKFGSKVIQRQKSLDITMPALPAKKGKTQVLRFYAYTKSKSTGGCMYNMTVKLNGKTINRKTADGKDRLISRESSFQLKSSKDRVFPVFGGDKIMLVYAQSLGDAQSVTKDDSGALFDLNIFDLVMGVDGNTLTFENIYSYSEPGELIIDHIEVGYLDNSFLKEPEIELPKRGKIKEQVKVGKLTLMQGSAGGFVVNYDKNIELIAETGLGIDEKIQPLLIADDRKLNNSAVDVNIEQSKDNVINISATTSSLKLSRKINIENGIIYFEDTWENTGKQDEAVPFKYDFWLRNKKSKVIISGDDDSDVLISSSPNPTIFIEAEGGNGAGFGITAENNLARLIMWFRRKPSFAEMFTKSFAVPAGKKLTVKMSITPVEKGGYWAFINELRDRWKVNGITMDRPVFWGISNAKGANTADILKKSLGHLGPVYIVNSPWLGLGWDSIDVRNGNYPKAEGGTTVAGKCPDLDIKKYISFEHREKYWKQLKETVRITHEVCPDVKILQMIHPSMEIVYKPLLESFPFSDDAIIVANGKPFELDHFNKAWVGSYDKKDWAVLYFAPKDNSAYADYLIKTIVRALDECQLDGIYCDEFSFAFSARGYSRYDHRAWDGFSVELDDNGKISRKMSDNGLVTLKFKQKFLNEILSRDKYFIGNGGAATKELQASPMFVEGGNGEGKFASVHLTGVPLIFGNFGDYKTKKGVFVNTKKCLNSGCMYSPFRGNLLLDNPDNFITKAYPISVKQIGPGTIIGKERIITTNTQNIKWADKDSTVQYYKYDHDGNLSDKIKGEVKNGGELKIDVLKDGLTIVEIK